ncbi:hypothetical protein AB0D49_14525 [Streptomyces sp. NPDC048290]
MRSPPHTAAARGATPDGHALYTSLGWRAVAPPTSAKYLGANAGVSAPA